MNSLQLLSQLFAEGYENPEQISGICQIVLLRGGETDYLKVEVGEKPTISMATDKTADATITMPFTMLQRIVEESQWIDFRDADVMSLISLSGDRQLINFIARMMLMPGEEIQERITAYDQVNKKAFGLSELERVSNPTEEYILQALVDCRPFIVTDMPAYHSHNYWTLTKLKETYNDVLLRVRSEDEQETVGQFVIRMEKDLVKNEADPEKVIDGFNKIYTEGCRLPEAMKKEFCPPYFTLHDYIEPQIWLGCVPVSTPASSLHRDPYDGFLYQLIGRKKLIMYPPNQAGYLYPLKSYNNYQPCWVNPHEPDLQRYPLFEKAQGIVAELHPGELLIQPAGWFHAVHCIDSPTFSVSHFYSM